MATARWVGWIGCGLLCLTGCGGSSPVSRYAVTPGGHVPSGPNPATEALVASANEDTGCDPARIETRILWGRPDHFIAEACGERLTYVRYGTDTDTGWQYRLLLIGRVALRSPAPPRAAATAPVPGQSAP